MASEMYLAIRDSQKHDWDMPNKCCEMNRSHFAIIAKSNIIEGIEAKE